MKPKEFVQYLTNVSYQTCETCLSQHGRIARDGSQFRNLEDGCERRLLPFPRKELRARREQGRKMEALARAELRRRALMAEASQLLGSNPDRALELFRAAVAIDVFLPELEGLAEEHADALRANELLRGALWDLFTRAYSAKFGWRRVEQRMPEPVRVLREQAGLERLNALYG